MAAGSLNPAAIDVSCLADAMPTAGLPPLDLVIRTSGEQRISNFMLWEMAYAELMFVDAAWPDFGEEPLRACLAQFGKRSRRFGLTSAQL